MKSLFTVLFLIAATALFPLAAADGSLASRNAQDTLPAMQDCVNRGVIIVIMGAYNCQDNTSCPNAGVVASVEGNGCHGEGTFVCLRAICLS